MKTRTYISSLLIAGALSFVITSCSSSARVVTSGGAIVFLRFADSGGTCPDLPVSPITIATKDASSSVPKLTLDGADGAVVRCRYDASRFDLSVAQNGYTLVANGTFVAGSNVTNDVAVSLVLPTGALYQTATKKCSLSVIRNTEADFYATLECARIDHQTLTGAVCGIGSGTLGANAFKSFMQFADCEGF